MNKYQPYLTKIKQILPASISPLSRIQFVELIIFSIISIGFLCYFTFTDFLNGDEREHITATFYIYNGQIPYRDFFEHHHPLLWYIFVPILSLFSNSAYIWYAARAFTLFLLALNCFFIIKISRLITPNYGFAWLAGILSLIPHCVFLSQTEFRPDSLMITLFLCGLYYLYDDIKEQKNKLIISFLFFFLSIMALQKACFQLIPITLLIVYLLYKKTICFKIFIKALILPLLLMFLYTLYLWYNNALKDYFELNWLLNLKIHTHIQYPVHQTAYYYIANTLALLTLFIKTPKLLKITALLCLSTSFILQFIFIGAFRHYWLPLYPYFAIISAYYTITLSAKIRTAALSAILAATIFNYINYYKANKSFIPLQTFVYLSQQVLNLSDKNDLIIGGSSTIGGLRKDASGYYWFARDHIALLDYHYFKRHEFPNRDAIIKARHPKLFSTESWRTCITEDYHFTFDCKSMPTSKEDQDYIDKHYSNRGFIYVRKN